MNLINDFIKSIKKICNNNEMCVMVVFIVIGFMLCYLFKDQINGYVNFAPINSGGNLLDSQVKLDDKPILSNEFISKYSNNFVSFQNYKVMISLWI